MKKLGSTRTVLIVTLFCAITLIAARAQTYQALLEFGPASGKNPNWLVLGSDGNMYGTTFNGGESNAFRPGQGTVFSVTPSGDVKTGLYIFCIGPGSPYKCFDGAGPKGVVLGTDGNFYGTTYKGGATDSGTVFQLTPGSVLTTLYSFCSETNCTDGTLPLAGVVEGADGNFYGTTGYGGANNFGTVFRITPAGVFSTLYSFCAQTNCADGEAPGALTLGNAGNLYGTTSVGGAKGNGTVFRITPTGALTTLHSFCSEEGCADGWQPTSLIQGIDGNFYGTTNTGGANNGGTAFRLTPAGVLTPLYSFCSASNCADGKGPNTMGEDSNGNFYGTTIAGGFVSEKWPSGCGTLFSLSLNGVLSTIYDFCTKTGGSQNGAYPDAVVQLANGSFYGTTSVGGTVSDGVLYSLSVGVALPPTFTPSALIFGNQKVNTTSKPKSITVTNVNTGSATLDFSGFTVGGPFAISSNTCQATLAAGKSCKINITFTPTFLEAPTGMLRVSDNAPDSPQTVALSGTAD
jgi:uncharacterized repeat protein (TIGR03803 family)